MPDVPWGESYRLSRLHGLSPDMKSFLFKMIHTLLPSRERVHHLTPASSPLCWCGTGVPETYLHLFYECPKNDIATIALIQCVKSYDRQLKPRKSLHLELAADLPFLLPSVAILATWPQFIWKNRKLKKSTSLFAIRAELEAAVSLRRRSSSSKIREAGKIMSNMISNFLL